VDDRTKGEALLADVSGRYLRLKDEIGRVIIGQNEVIEELLISLVCKGHCLLVGCRDLPRRCW